MQEVSTEHFISAYISRFCIIFSFNMISASYTFSMYVCTCTIHICRKLRVPVRFENAPSLPTRGWVSGLDVKPVVIDSSQVLPNKPRVYQVEKLPRWRDTGIRGFGRVGNRSLSQTVRKRHLLFQFPARWRWYWFLLNYYLYCHLFFSLRLIVKRAPKLLRGFWLNRAPL